MPPKRAPVPNHGVVQYGLGSYGLEPYGLGPYGLGPYGLGPDGIGPDGLEPDGFGPYAFGPYEFGLGGLPMDFDSGAYLWSGAYAGAYSKSWRTTFSKCHIGGLP